MKISNDKNIGVLETLIKPANSKVLKQTTANWHSAQDSPDKVELSSRKQEIEAIKDKVKASPAIRQEKVDQIKEAIKSETYNVQGKLVARSILKSSILDEIL